jgi:hypothetical protein
MNESIEEEKRMTARQIDRALEKFRAGERDLYTEEGQRRF